MIAVPLQYASAIHVQDEAYCSEQLVTKRAYCLILLRTQLTPACRPSPVFAEHP